MTHSSVRIFSALSTAFATASLAFVFSVSVSPQALAACTPAASPGNDTVVCDGVQAGNVSLGAGNDKLTVNEGAQITGNINGQAGSDLIVIKGGAIAGDVTTGTSTGSINDTNDRIFMFDGEITGGEVQLGSGLDNYFFFMGGAIQPNTVGRGSVEINRGSRNSVLVFDGGTLTVDEGFEFQDGNNSVRQAARNPVIYLRSGKIVAEELELTARDWQTGDVPTNMGGAGATGPQLTDVTLIIDPVNSKDQAYFRDLASNAVHGGDLSLGTEALNRALFDAPGNLDEKHQMILEVAEVEFGGGNDTLVFDGAVNAGDRWHNLVLKGEEEEPGEFEITEFEGGDGVDRIIVKGESDLRLGEIEGFEFLSVLGSSKLTLGGEEGGEYEFEEEVLIDGTSVLTFVGPEVSLETEHFELMAGEGQGRLEGLPSYYASFATGGVLQIGAPAGAGEDDGEEEDGEEEDDEGLGGSTHLKITTGDSTFVNNGTVSLLNGRAGDGLTIVGPYTSQGGNLAVDVDFNSNGAQSDQVAIDGTVAGTTTVYVNNLGGKGSLTGPGGIAIVSNPAGAFSADSFRLARNAVTGREEIVVGALSYRLATTDGEVVLRSDVLDQVPAYSTAPSVAQRLVSNGLDTLYKRLGEIRLGRNEGMSGDGGPVWVRGSHSDVDVDARVGSDFTQRSSGVMAGVGGTIASDGAARLAVGGFGGYSTADARVNSVIFGRASTASIDATSWSFGAYATYYQAGGTGTGLYFDAVVKSDFIDFDMAGGGRGARGSTSGDALTGSAEIGYGISLGALVVQPQAQISYTDLSIDGFTDSVPYKVGVAYRMAESMVGRLGLQLQTNLQQPGGGVISPYAIFNVFSEFEGSNRSEAGGLLFVSDVSGTWYSAGGGINAKLAESLSFYGSGEYHFGDVEGWQGTGGLKLNW